jgi:hypothetical protein
MIKFRRAEMQTLHTQLNILKIPDMLEQTVLEELVDDVLIQQGITEAANKRELDPLDLEQRVRVDVGRFQSYEGANYPILLSQNRLTEQDVVDVLQVFARRNQFAWYLFERNPPSSIEAWLEQRKKNKKTKIERHLPVPQNAAGAGWPGIRQ